MEPRKGKQVVTLKDIAETTGYSVNTISRALRGKDDIAGETRDKIKQVARELGYINNTIASSLRLGYTNTIAVILSDVSNPHFSIMMKEIEAHARQLNYFSFLINTDENEELEREAIQSALNKNVDGIILCPTQKSTDNIAYLNATGVPFVLIGRHFKDMPADAVICNDKLGGYQATKCLLEQGHRDILMLQGPSYISSAEERRAGYLQALEEFNVPVRRELICEVSITEHGCGAALSRLDEEGIRYSAVFAFNDLLAWEAWDYQLKAGRRVPEDCSIIGFDHIQSRLVLPFRLSSICSYKGRMSTTAVELLARRMRGESGEAMRQTVVIDTALEVGDTVAPHQ